MSRDSHFWPTGWLVWFCVALGAFDVSLLAFITTKIITRF